MAECSVVVTFDCPAEQRAVLRETLGPAASLVYLVDRPDDERRRVLEGADVLLSWNVPRELSPADYGHLGRAGLMQLLSAHADHVPFADLPAPLEVASNPGAYAGPMAEHVMAMVLALAKRLLPEHEKLRCGEFDQLTPTRELAGMTAGVLGFGGIGRAAACLMRTFGMRIQAINTSGATSEPVDFVGTLADLGRVLEASDVVLVALPLNRHTVGLIGRGELARMKDDAILVNVARGPIIDQDELWKHASCHPDFMVGIDAWWTEPFSHGRFETDHPFLDLPNVLGSPHNSAVVPGSLASGARRAAENVLRYLRSEEVEGVVDRGDYL